MDASSLQFWNMMLLATARTAAAVFLVVFLASTLRKLWQTPLTAWLLRNRRYWGLTFAAIMAVHLVAIFVSMKLNPEMVPQLKLHPFMPFASGVGYLFLAAMAATSSNRAIRKLGAKRWKLLHSTGMYILWIDMFVTYAVRFTWGWEFAAASIVYALALILKVAVKLKPVKAPRPAIAT